MKFWVLLVLLCTVWGIRTNFRKKIIDPKSSLFQTWAAPPYMYPYMQAPGPLNPPGYFPYSYQGPPPPMGYYPPPQPTYYQQQFQYAPPMGPAMIPFNYQGPPNPPVVAYQPPPVMMAAQPMQQISQMTAQAPEAASKAATTTQTQTDKLSSVESAATTTASPMKAELSRALNDAMKQMDKVTDSALDLSTFDNLRYVPPASPPPVRLSLSQDTVPIDNHILNWRELVGLPSTNSLTEKGKDPVTESTTPLLSGKWNLGN